MTIKAKLASLLSALVALAITAPSAQAQGYPSKPVTFVIGFAPGGPSDVLSRILCKKLEEILKQAFVIENKAGAGGGIAAAHVARQAPDGYTLILASTNMLAGNQYIYENISYDPQKDFEPISIVGQQPNVLFVHPSVPAQNFKEFVAYAQANPGKLSYGTGGVGTSSHFGGEQLKREAKFNMVHVAHRGTGQVIQAVIGGHIQVGMNPPAPLIPLIQAGQIRPLAVSSLKRTGALPDVPTVAEQGFPGFEAIVWHGVMGPAGLPKEVVDTLHKALLQTLKDERINKQLTELGVDVWGTTPDEFRKEIARQIPHQGEMARLAGVKKGDVK
jgi:tripartite-type tricarboxylate transporter receptor subunit TctC